MRAIGGRHDVTKSRSMLVSAFISGFDVSEGRQLCATGIRPKKLTISTRERLRAGLIRTVLGSNRTIRTANRTALANYPEFTSRARPPAAQLLAAGGLFIGGAENL